ncbi:hypothetical protein K438DRAFT_2096549 [Mycena galopus ATCC 62051]|nr:hypothetical protein K438DRAFT_2096549 [Mycena galopus ATCC 62051]
MALPSGVELGSFNTSSAVTQELVPHHTTGSLVATEFADMTVLSSPPPARSSYIPHISSVSLSLRSSVMSTSLGAFSLLSTCAAQLPALDAELQRLPLVPSRSIEAEVELGGHVEEQSNRNSIGPVKYMELLPSTVLVLVVGVRTVELGEQMDTSVLHQQSLPKPDALSCKTQLKFQSSILSASHVGAPTAAEDESAAVAEGLVEDLQNRAECAACGQRISLTTWNLSASTSICKGHRVSKLVEHCNSLALREYQRDSNLNGERGRTTDTRSFTTDSSRSLQGTFPPSSSTSISLACIAISSSSESTNRTVLRPEGSRSASITDTSINIQEGTLDLSHAPMAAVPAAIKDPPSKFSKQPAVEVGGRKNAACSVGQPGTRENNGQTPTVVAQSDKQSFPPALASTVVVLAVGGADAEPEFRKLDHAPSLNIRTSAKFGGKLGSKAIKIHSGLATTTCYLCPPLLSSPLAGVRSSLGGR